MATINFVVSGNRIATESFAIGKIYEIIFTNGNFLICACNHVGNNFVVFQRELPELLFTLNMETASSVRSIEETRGGGGTYNYNSLENKPQINSVELSGNKSSSDLGLQSALDTSQLDAVNSGITAAKVTAFEGKQDAITSNSKLSADLVDDVTTTNKFVTAADKAAWNAKQNALTASQLDAVNSGITAAKVTAFEGKQDAITSDNKLSADLVDDATTTNKFVTAADKTAWNAKQNALTASQLDAVNSGIDSTKVEQIETNKSNILSVQEQANWNTNNCVKNISPYNNGTTSTGEGTVWNNLPIDIPAGTYSVSFLTDSTNSAFVLLAADGTTEVLRKTYSATNVSDTFTISTAAKFIRLYIGASKTVSNFMIHSFGDNTFVPYAMSNAELTAKEQQNENNISKDEAALVEIVDGGAKNRLNYNIATFGDKSKVTINQDGSITGSITSDTRQYAWSNREFEFTLPAGDYVLCIKRLSGSNVYTSARLMAAENDNICSVATNPNIAPCTKSFTLDTDTTIGFIGKVFTDTIQLMLCTKAAWDISQKYVPYRPSYQELYEMVKALQAQLANQ